MSQLMNPYEVLDRRLNSIEKLLLDIYTETISKDTSNTTPLFSRKEAAQYLNISLGTLNTLMKTKQLNCSYIGNSPKFKLEDLEEFVNSRK